QILQEAPRHLAHTALAHDRLDEDASRGLADRCLHPLDVAGLNLVEAVCRRAEALEVLGLTASSDGGERPPMKGAFERDESITLRLTVFEVEAARGLDGAFHGFRA